MQAGYAMDLLIAEPDITLRLDATGVIRDARVANSVAAERIEDWIGVDWSATVGDDTREALDRLLATVFDAGSAASGQIAQRFPSGLLLPVEYTAVRLDANQGLIAVGRQLRAVADLQGRLLDAQRTMERDYWKLRQVETRYRMLFEAANDALVTLSNADLRVLEVNPVAAELLEMNPRQRAAARGTDPRDWLRIEARDEFDRLLEQVRERGSTPAVVLALGGGRPSCLVRGSLVGVDKDAILVLQLAPMTNASGTGNDRPHAAKRNGNGAAAAEVAERELTRRQASLIERCPDGYLIIDRSGRILRANAAFVEMAQVGSESALLGESFGRWLASPGADFAVLLANLERFGSVRMFSTRVRGALDSEVDVEISATGNTEHGADVIGLVVRDVGRRLASPAPAPSGAGPLATSPETLTSRLGKTPLRTLVDEAVAEVERHYLTAALELTGGNRSAAAQLLGISRQSLHSKLIRLGLSGLPLGGLPRQPRH
jgi:transcriptional regulator PpsR